MPYVTRSRARTGDGAAGGGGQNENNEPKATGSKTKPVPSKTQAKNGQKKEQQQVTATTSRKPVAVDVPKKLTRAAIREMSSVSSLDELRDEASTSTKDSQSQQRAEKINRHDQCGSHAPVASSSKTKAPIATSSKQETMASKLTKGKPGRKPKVQKPIEPSRQPHLLSSSEEEPDEEDNKPSMSSKTVPAKKLPSSPMFLAPKTRPPKAKQMDMSPVSIVSKSSRGRVLKPKQKDASDLSPVSTASTKGKGRTRSTRSTRSTAKQTDTSSEEEVGRATRSSNRQKAKKAVTKSTSEDILKYSEISASPTPTTKHAITEKWIQAAGGSQSSDEVSPLSIISHTDSNSQKINYQRETIIEELTEDSDDLFEPVVPKVMEKPKSKATSTAVKKGKAKAPKSAEAAMKDLKINLEPCDAVTSAPKEGRQMQTRKGKAKKDSLQEAVQSQIFASQCRVTAKSIETGLRPLKELIETLSIPKEENEFFKEMRLRTEKIQLKMRAEKQAIQSQQEDKRKAEERKEGLNLVENRDKPPFAIVPIPEDLELTHESICSPPRKIVRRSSEENHPPRTVSLKSDNLEKSVDSAASTSKSNENNEVQHLDLSVAIIDESNANGVIIIEDEDIPVVTDKNGILKKGSADSGNYSSNGRNTEISSKKSSEGKKAQPVKRSRSTDDIFEDEDSPSIPHVVQVPRTFNFQESAAKERPLFQASKKFILDIRSGNSEVKSFKPALPPSPMAEEVKDKKPSAILPISDVTFEKKSSSKDSEERSTSSSSGSSRKSNEIPVSAAAVNSQTFVTENMDPNADVSISLFESSDASLDRSDNFTEAVAKGAPEIKAVQTVEHELAAVAPLSETFNPVGKSAINETFATEKAFKLPAKPSPKTVKPGASHAADATFTTNTNRISETEKQLMLNETVCINKPKFVHKVNNGPPPVVLMDTDEPWLSASALESVVEEDDNASIASASKDKAVKKPVHKTAKSQDRELSSASASSSASSTSSYKSASSQPIGPSKHVAPKTTSAINLKQDVLAKPKFDFKKNALEREEEAKRKKAQFLFEKQEIQRKKNEEWKKKAEKIKMEEEKKKPLVTSLKPKVVEKPILKPTKLFPSAPQSKYLLEPMSFKPCGPMFKSPTPAMPKTLLGPTQALKTNSSQRPIHEEEAYKGGNGSIFETTAESTFSSYDITRYEDLDEDMKHRENKHIPDWAKDKQGMTAALFKQVVYRDHPLIHLTFPDVVKGYRIYPSK